MHCLSCGARNLQSEQQQHTGSLAIACETSFPDRRLNLCPLNWEQGILATGLPGKSQQAFLRLYFVCVKVLVAQSCLTLCDPVDCSPPGSSVHGILQARMLEWVAIPFSRASYRPRDQILVSHITGRFFTTGATR